MQKYIHIGYPKNFSTSLQRDYFSGHSEIFHLGIGLDNNLGYYDSIIENTFEVYLKTCKSLKYKEYEDGIIAHFQKLFQSSIPEKKAIGISSEHISFSFSYDSLGVEEKAWRLHRIFGSDTKIIMIIRNQFDLIKSLYRESVRVGFIGDFSNYVELIYKYQDRNFIYDFRYDMVYEVFSKLFGSENIHVINFENYRDESGNLTKEDGYLTLFRDLNSILNINDVNIPFNHFNEALPSNKVLIKAQLNKSSRHDLGNHLLESAEKHRIKKYLETELNFIEEESNTYSDVLKKRDLITQSITSDESIELNYLANKMISDSLKKFYEEGNKRLESIAKIVVPESYHFLEF